MKVEISKRLASLPPYPFALIDKKKKKAIEQGKDVISFGIGDPDYPTPQHILDAAADALKNPKYHHYPFEQGLSEFREAVASWFMKRFKVKLNPKTEIYSSIGSKDGLAHTHFAFINKGDGVLMPDPGYPVYYTGTIFTDGKPYLIPLNKENGFLPDLKSVPTNVLSNAKILFINSPNNPTSAVGDEKHYRELISYAKKYNFIIAHDAAYSEIYYDKPPISFLSVPGAMDVGIEYHSLSKTFNMTGWRIGWFCGNAKLVAAVGKIKTNFDSGVFEVVQKAAVAALTSSQDCVKEMRKIYKERRDILTEGLKSLGWKFNIPEASFYIWAEAPKGYTSVATVEKLIEKASLITVPGSGFGANGEGYIRFALTVPKERIVTGLDRLSKVRW